jgi:dihydrofolate synthase/folylpolyglutamate synthase
MREYTYEQVLDIIENSRRFGNIPGVEVTKRMLEKLGKTERCFPFIHVAGTNGKGSTCAFLSKIFDEAGLKVGLFTSPHLIDFCERIQINGEMIPQGEVTRLGNFLLSQDFGVTPTMFDYCLLMAILYFEESGCDLAVFETGLGGRLDSTNAIGNPAVSVITRIGFDHMGILGDTLEEIAGEKAGIIKPGVPVVIAPQEEEAMRVLNKAADKAGLTTDLCHRQDENSQQIFVVDDKTLSEASAMNPRLLGAYQIENAAAAILAARALFLQMHSCEAAWSIDFDKTETFIERGIQTAFWPGRMEILSERPFLMVDGAHNSNGIKALADSLKIMYPGEKFHFVMAVMADKDYEKMIEILLPLAFDFVTVTAESKRALQAEKLATAIQKKGVPARSISSVKEVLSLPVENEKTIALGSLYFIGELKNYVLSL